MKYIYTLLFVAISAASFAQGNLQFNQVLNFNYEATISANSAYAIGSVIVDILTVPVGKVWKITTASCKDTGYNRRNTSIAINNHYLYEVRGSSQYGVVSNNTPYWLSSGTINEVEIFNNYTTSSSSNTITAVGAISVIEFNIVP